MNTKPDEAGQDSAVMEFLSFCVEKYAEKHNMSGSVVMDEFKKHGTLDYIIEGYDVLHTQGPGYIIPDIEAQMGAR